MMLAPLPFSIFSYSSYLEFFQDAYEYSHSRDEKISYDAIATACSLKSRTHARNLLKGTQKPTAAELKLLGNYFGLTGNEAQYLEALLHFEQAQATPAAFDIFQKLMAAQKAARVKKNPLKEIEVATSLLHMTLLSVLDLQNAPESVPAIKVLLKDRFSEEVITKALLELEEIEFIRKNESEAGWTLIHKHVKNVDLNPSFFLKKFHEQCLEVAKHSLENELPGQRYLVGSNFTVNAKVFPRIVQKLNAFLENLMQLEGVAGSADTVVQINAQLIKMTVDSHAKKESGLGAGENHAERAFSN